MNITTVLLDAFKILALSLIVIGAYVLPRDAVKKTSRPSWHLYLDVIAIIAFLSVIIAAGYGTVIEGGDPLYGGGEEVAIVDVTMDMQIEHGLYFFLILVIPAVIGVYRGNAIRIWEKEKPERERRAKLENERFEQLLKNIKK